MRVPGVELVLWIGAFNVSLTFNPRAWPSLWEPYSNPRSGSWNLDVGPLRIGYWPTTHHWTNPRGHTPGVVFRKEL